MGSTVPARHRKLLILLLLCGWTGFVAPAPGQTGNVPLVPAQVDPSDAYFQGYLAVRAAERLDTQGDHIGAAEKYRKAIEIFDTVKQYHPEWKTDMVKRRGEITREALAATQERANQQLEKKRTAIAELEGGTRRGANADGSKPDSSSILTVDPLVRQKLDMAEQEIKRLESELAEQSIQASKLNATTATAERVNELNYRREFLINQLLAAKASHARLKGDLTSAPIAGQMSELNQKIERLDQERQAMALTLRQSQESYTDAQKRITALEEELRTARQQAANLNRDLDTERSTTNAVIAGQRRQLEALQKQLDEKSQALDAANRQISELKGELDESRQALAQSRQERDALLLEREQMSALLKLNEDGRIQDLIDQNMSLAKSLREAKDRFDRLYRESNADKDAITDALRDLAVAKSQIQRLREEKTQQEARIAELEAQLAKEDASLASGTSSTDPQEVIVLREIIKRQIVSQKRRQQASELLIAAVRKLGSDDAQLASALDVLEGEEVVLSPEEQKLIADQKVDEEFVSPYARSRGEVQLQTDKLKQDIELFDRTATRSFVDGRLHSTRELFEMILDQHPGHTPTLCKIGVVHLKLDNAPAAVDSFRRAVELEGGNAFAHRMLGYALMKDQQLEAAEQSARKSVELNSADAKAQMLLATLCYLVGKIDEAESHFKGAINVDPIPSEPYYNLALLCSSTGRLDQAQEYYRKALERGALPDPELEKSLVSH